MFFKSVPKRKPTIPRDPFSRNRQFKLVKPAPVVIRQGQRKKFTFIDPAQLLRKRQEKRDAARHAKFKAEHQLTSSPQQKRVAFSKKVTVHGENDQNTYRKEVTEAVDHLGNGTDGTAPDTSQTADGDENDGQDGVPPLPPLSLLPAPPQLLTKRTDSVEAARLSLPALPQLPTPPLPQIRRLPPPPSRGAPSKLTGYGPAPRMPPPSSSKPKPQQRRLPAQATAAGESAAGEPAEEAARPESPLDFLSRYCIVHLHRLPAYEAVFRRTVAKQPFRYEPYRATAEQAELAAAAAAAAGKSARIDSATASATSGRHNAASPQLPVVDRSLSSGENVELSAEELYHRQLQCRVGGRLTEAELMQLTRKLQIGWAGQAADRDTFRSPCDAELSKQQFILDRLLERQRRHQSESAELEAEREALLSRLALERYQEVLAPALAAAGRAAQGAGKKSAPPPASLAAHHLLTPRQLATVEAVPEAQRQAARLERCRQLAEHVENRLVETREAIRRLAALGSRDLLGQQLRQRRRAPRGGLLEPEEATTIEAEEAFRREQSLIYQRLRPDIDLELNTELLESALSEVNGHLISRRELQYVHRLLRLPGRSRLNFRLFSIVAALSEKIVQLEPILRKLVNKLDFDALDFKVDCSRELFCLLEAAGSAPPGCVAVEGLAVELLAGNLKDEHIGSVMRKLTREKKGYIDFLDFLTYVPLFLEIHQRIVADPLSSDVQW